MISSILVAVDSSPTAQRALGQAVELAQALHARLTVVTVVPSLPAVAYQVPTDVSELERAVEVESAKTLRTAVDSVPQDVGVEHVLRHGNAASELIKQLEEGGHDLLVMGSRGRGRFATEVLGSVGASVHFNAHVPVLSVPPVEET